MCLSKPPTTMTMTTIATNILYTIFFRLVLLLLPFSVTQNESGKKLETNSLFRWIVHRLENRLSFPVRSTKERSEYIVHHSKWCVKWHSLDVNVKCKYTTIYVAAKKKPRNKIPLLVTWSFQQQKWPTEIKTENHPFPRGNEIKYYCRDIVSVR